MSYEKREEQEEEKIRKAMKSNNNNNNNRPQYVLTHTRSCFLIEKTIVHTIWWRALTDKRTILRRAEKERKAKVLKNEKKKDKA